MVISEPIHEIWTILTAELFEVKLQIAQGCEFCSGFAQNSKGAHSKYKGLRQRLMGHTSYTCLRQFPHTIKLKGHWNNISRIRFLISDIFWQRIVKMRAFLPKCLKKLQKHQKFNKDAYLKKASVRNARKQRLYMLTVKQETRRPWQNGRSGKERTQQGKP